MGERFLLSLCFVLFFSLFCFSLLPCFSILFCRCSSLRSRYSLYISPLYGFNSMQPCVFSFWFNRRTFASMGNFGELMFRYRHFPRFLFSFVVALFFYCCRCCCCPSLVLFCFRADVRRVFGSNTVTYFYGTVPRFLKWRQKSEIGCERQNGAWIFHESTNDDFSFTSISIALFTNRLFISFIHLQHDRRTDSISNSKIFGEK